MKIIHNNFSNNTNFQGRFARSIDFADKYTSRNATMYLYTGCILSRLVNSRDKYEFKETLTRDSVGWASLFFLASTFEKTVGLLIEKTDNYNKKKNGKLPADINATPNLFLSKTKNKHDLPGLFNVLNPLDNKFTVRSFSDIDALGTIDENLKNSLMKKKTALYLMSLAFSIGVIGIFIPWLNTITTKKSVKDEHKAILPAIKKTNSMDNYLRSTNNLI
jgi:hypothetical protein